MSSDKWEKLLQCDQMDMHVCIADLSKSTKIPFLSSIWSYLFIRCIVLMCIYFQVNSPVDQFIRLIISLIPMYYPLIYCQRHLFILHIWHSIFNPSTLLSSSTSWYSTAACLFIYIYICIYLTNIDTHQISNSMSSICVRDHCVFHVAGKLLLQDNSLWFACLNRKQCTGKLDIDCISASTLSANLHRWNLISILCLDHSLSMFNIWNIHVPFLAL